MSATSIIAIQDSIVAEFEAFQNWDERYKHIIQLGKQLAPIAKELQTEEHEVKGCQSTVWMHASRNEDGTIHYVADSDALIVRGLVALILRVYSDQPANVILNTEPSFIERINMSSHLSMQRSNGLAAMIKQMKLYAQVFLMQAQLGQT